MQKYIKNGRKQATYKPDVLIRGKGVGWHEASDWYRQTGDDYGHTPITAKFRPSGWTKTYEYDISFNDKENSYGSDIIIKINRLGNQGDVIASRPMLGISTSVEQKNCPFCNSLSVFDDIKSRWKCTDITCQFNYSADTCKLMYEEFKDDKEVKNVQRRFSNFEALSKLGETSDMAVTTNKYKL